MTDIRAVILLPERRPVARPRPGASLPWRAVRRGLWIFAGFALIALGAVGAVLPGHLGLLVVVPGLGLVLRNSWQAKRAFVRLQRRWPNWVHPLRRLMRPKPEIAPVMWQALLRTERFLLWRLRRWRVLGRTRRALRRRFAG